VRLGIIPIELLLMTPDLIAIPVYDDRQAIVRKPFPNDEADTMIEEEFSRYAGKRRASAYQSQSRMPDGWIMVGKRVQV